MASTIPDTASQNNRKALLDEMSARSRPLKRRASRACCCCRSRRIRCDVIENGLPCNNCRLDRVECVVPESRRRRRFQVDAEISELRLHPSTQSVDVTKQQISSQRSDEVDHSGLGSPMQEEASSVPQGSASLYQGQHMSHSIYPSDNPHVENLIPLDGRSGCNQTIPIPAKIESNSPNAVQQSLTLQERNDLLPKYIRSLPHRYQIKDTDYLAAQGALTIPEDSLRNNILKAYIYYVHPYMPLLDLEEFLQTIARNDRIKQISLLLFQAIMFAGVAFVNLEHLNAEGYSNRKVARKVFYQRVRLLYDLDYEGDRLTLIQSLLLMTYWYDTPDDQKDSWHWMGASLSLAQTIALHREPKDPGFEHQRKRLYRRIWWSMYTRDRLIALCMRRPIRVRDGDYNMPMLNLDDFVFKKFPPEVLNMVGDCELLQNTEYQRHLAIMFIEKVKLCLCIGHVSSTQYSASSHHFEGTTADKTTALMLCDEELGKWQADLPPEAQYISLGRNDVLSPAEESLQLHRALLRMVYLTTSSTLHRPQVLPAMAYPSIKAALQELSHKRVRCAAIEITEIAQDLHQFELTRYLPTTIITVLLSALMTHLLDVRSDDLERRRTSSQHFRHCIHILQHLRQFYTSADFATSFLEAAIRKAGIFTNLSDSNSNVPARTGHENIHPIASPLAPDFPASNVPDFTAASSPSDTLLAGFTFPLETDSGKNNDEVYTNKAATRAYHDSGENGKTRLDLSVTDFNQSVNDAGALQNNDEILSNFNDGNTELFSAVDQLGNILTFNNTVNNDIENLGFHVNDQPPNQVHFQTQDQAREQPRFDYLQVIPAERHYFPTAVSTTGTMVLPLMAIPIWVYRSSYDGSVPNMNV